jgi:nicotinate phosphoribosyltransferase
MNDFKTKSSGYTEKSRALNTVIKLAKVDDRDCVKLTDDMSKVQCTGDFLRTVLTFPPSDTGDKASVEFVKKLYGLAN